MNLSTLTSEQLKGFVRSLISEGPVIGIQKKEDKYAFGPLENFEDLTLGYDVSLLPPKEYIMPPSETLIRFKIKLKTQVHAASDATPLTIIGIHPYDLKAINLMDRFFNDTTPDNHYAARRKAITIIAVTPKRASKWAFWSSMGSSFVEGGFDILLTDIGEKYIAETGSSHGETILKKYAQVKTPTREELGAYERVKHDLTSICDKDRKLAVSPEAIPSLIEANYDSKLWGREAEKCYSCGSCVLVCPTCVCFDVKENLELDLNEGARSRVWDACLLENFAKVASGENFREERTERYRHRMFRKAVYLHKKLGSIYCVGCGRCCEACLPDIADPVKIINALKEIQ